MRGFIALYLDRNVFHRCALSRSRMMHVVNNLSAFLMFEVMETAWAKLLDLVQRAAVRLR
jgi:hypothetical protein